ncbi:hypothetical protein ACFL0D_05470 [Thermoproteota archaeon]
MSENEGFYTFLGKIDAFDGQYIGGVKGIKKLMEKLNIQKDPDFKVLCKALLLSLVKILRAHKGKNNINEYKLHYLSGEPPLELERDLEICRERVKLRIKF